MSKNTQPSFFYQFAISTRTLVGLDQSLAFSCHDTQCQPVCPSATFYIEQRLSKYSRLRFGVEKHFRNVFRNRLTKKIIRYIDTFIPFSPVQNDFMLNHLDKPIHPFSVAWRQSVLTSRDYDFIPIYGRMQNVDWNYFEKVRSRFAEQLVCLCEPDEYEACKQVFPGRTQYIFTPLPHLDYIKWYKEAKRIIIPFKKKVSFGLSREVLGSTKYLWRIYWALQFDKSLLMSDDIIRPEIPESPSLQIPQFEEIIRFLEDRMEEKP